MSPEQTDLRNHRSIPDRKQSVKNKDKGTTKKRKEKALAFQVLVNQFLCILILWGIANCSGDLMIQEFDMSNQLLPPLIFMNAPSHFSFRDVYFC